ncbi:hypothetical protein BaRGS_00014019 [Batillaria attramentaria]|uniref:Uncharacterized protein n=1 Tax=Batillaria attramentaria TaxID=370345 RepID=A0ABD0L4Z9_9CAEN
MRSERRVRTYRATGRNGGTDKCTFASSPQPSLTLPTDCLSTSSGRTRVHVQTGQVCEDATFPVIPPLYSLIKERCSACAGLGEAEVGESRPVVSTSLSTSLMAFGELAVVFNSLTSCTTSDRGLKAQGRLTEDQTGR